MIKFNRKYDLIFLEQGSFQIWIYTVEMQMHIIEFSENVASMWN